MACIQRCLSRKLPDLKESFLKREIVGPLLQRTLGISSNSFCNQQSVHKPVLDVKDSATPLYNLTKDVVKNINDQISNESHGRLFAVVYINGNQFKVTAEDLLLLNTNRTFPDVGERIILEKVLCVGSQDFTLIGRPLLSDLVRIEATVVEKTLSYNKIWFAYRRRKNSRKLKVVQDFQTVLRINSIQLADTITAADDDDDVD